MSEDDDDSLVSIGRLHNAVVFWAAHFEIPQKVVFAVVQKESTGNVYATRYERHFYNKYIEHKPYQLLGGYWPRNRTRDTERHFRAASWGCMQIMGQTARELGFDRDDFTELCNPEIGVKYGCMYLHKMIELYEGLELEYDVVLRNALAAYNGGPGSPNYRYADEVLTLCKNSLLQ